MARNRKQKRELYSRKAGSPKKFYRGLRLASRKGLCLARRLASIHYYRPPFHTRGWPDRTSRLVIISILQIQRNFHPTFDTPREKKKEREEERGVKRIRLLEAAGYAAREKMARLSRTTVHSRARLLADEQR